MTGYTAPAELDNALGYIIYLLERLNSEAKAANEALERISYQLGILGGVLPKSDLEVEIEEILREGRLKWEEGTLTNSKNGNGPGEDEDLEDGSSDDSAKQEGDT
jgi:hypothetical protein